MILCVRGEPMGITGGPKAQVYIDTRSLGSGDFAASATVFLLLRNGTECPPAYAYAIWSQVYVPLG
jgi:hypothetical protein